MTKQQSSHASKTKTTLRGRARLSAEILHHVTKHSSWHEQTWVQRWESTTCGWWELAGLGSHSGHLLSVIPGISSPQSRPIRAQYVRLSANQKQLRQSSALLRAPKRASRAQKAVRATVSVCVITTRRAHKALTRPLGIFLQLGWARLQGWVAGSPLARSHQGFLVQGPPGWPGPGCWLPGCCCWLRDILTRARQKHGGAQSRITNYLITTAWIQDLIR